MSNQNRECGARGPFGIVVWVDFNDNVWHKFLRKFNFLFERLLVARYQIRFLFRSQNNSYSSTGQQIDLLTIYVRDSRREVLYNGCHKV